MDHRLRHLAEQLDAGLIARREFLRKSAVITGGTAAGLGVLGKMAHAQSGTKMRVWLFKSFVTAGNDILAKQVEAWARGAEGPGRDGLGHLRRSRAEVRRRHRGRQSARHGRDELPRADAVQVRAARRDSKLAKDIASRARRPPALRRADPNINGQFFGVGRLDLPRRASSSGRICSTPRASSCPSSMTRTSSRWPRSARIRPRTSGDSARR